MKVRLLIFFLGFSIVCSAQNLTGLWVHESSNIPDAMYPIYAILYLTDNSGSLTGYSYDFQAGGTCSFYLEGEYNSLESKLIARNTTKIHKDLLHARSRYKLSYEVIDGEEYLIGRIRQKGVHGFLLSFGGIVGYRLKYRKVKPPEYEYTEGFDIIRPFIDVDKINFGKEFEETDGEIIVDENTINIDENTVNKSPVEVIETRATRKITRKKKRRKDKLLKSHTIRSRKLMLEILDKKYEDGDRVSIYVNDVLFQFNVEVKNISKQFELRLPSGRKTHKVLFVANNLGQLPPNTATIRYKIDGMFYEATLSTDKKENKYLEFIVEY